PPRLLATLRHSYEYGMFAVAAHDGILP
ncbi:MAG: hypothetical protein QOG73_1970, partial [Acetobacteraceae bacterium]|nr:hypothetical protein [Acetobacteraceae bacterium]